jgi:sulfite exporter TauE/SafE
MQALYIETVEPRTTLRDCCGKEHRLEAYSFEIKELYNKFRGLSYTQICFVMSVVGNSTAINSILRNYIKIHEFINIFLGASAKIAKSDYYLRHVCPSAWNKSAPPLSGFS